MLKYSFLSEDQINTVMEVANQSEKNRKALVLFGSDLYMKGKVKGALFGFGIVIIIAGVRFVIKNKDNKNF